METLSERMQALETDVRQTRSAARSFDVTRKWADELAALRVEVERLERERDRIMELSMNRAREIAELEGRLDNLEAR